jgi:opine dehydrogenase
MGHDVRLYSRSRSTVEPVVAAGGIAYSGVCGQGLARLSMATNDLSAALDEAEMVLLCLPANAHEELAQSLAPLLDGRAPIVLNPGSTGGALVLRKVLDEADAAESVTIGETNTLTYIARKLAPDSVYISSTVRNVRLSALPAVALDDLASRLRDYYPSLKPVATVLDTSLRNVNAVLHPPGVILAAAWIEHTRGDFRYYYDAGTPGVGRVMADLDHERLRVGRAWGVQLEPFPALFADIGSSSAEAAASGSYAQMLRDSEPNRFIKAPDSLEHRYILEDIPYGVVPMSEMGRAAGVSTPVMDSLVTLASSLSQLDLHATGWTLDRMGLPADPAAALPLLTSGSTR